jgi:phosphotriesterase-related protein
VTRRGVRTVLGDIAPGNLGPTDYHEHLFQSTPLLPGEDLNDEDASAEEAKALRRSGAAAMVEATPTGLGARPEAVARIAQASGLHIVHTTGMHREAHYGEADPLRAAHEDALRTLFERDLLEGMRNGRGRPALAPDGSPVRAGVLKAGIGLWSMSVLERRVLAAVAAVSSQWDAPVMVHLEHGSAAHEVLDVLAAGGCRPDRVALAHVDRNPDAGLLHELADRGAYLGFDGAARHQYWPDSVLVECLAQVASRGGGARILLGGDVARRSRYVAYGGIPGLGYLFDRFVPRVRDELGVQATDAILSTNPARWLSWPLGSAP